MCHVLVYLTNCNILYFGNLPTLYTPLRVQGEGPLLNYDLLYLEIYQSSTYPCLINSYVFGFNFVQILISRRITKDIKTNLNNFYGFIRTNLNLNDLIVFVMKKIVQSATRPSLKSRYNMNMGIPN